MDDFEPGPCTKCGREKKPLFRSYYCDCNEVTEQIKCPHGKPVYEGMLPTCNECREDYLSSIAGGIGLNAGTAYNAGLASALAPQGNVSGTYIRGHLVTHYLECRFCHNIAMYIDHDPLDSSRQGETISEANGFFQDNHSPGSGTQILCDSCNQPLGVANLQLKFVHKY